MPNLIISLIVHDGPGLWTEAGGEREDVRLLYLTGSSNQVLLLSVLRIRCILGRIRHRIRPKIDNTNFFCHFFSSDYSNNQIFEGSWFKRVKSCSVKSCGKKAPPADQRRISTERIPDGPKVIYYAHMVRRGIIPAGSMPGFFFKTMILVFIRISFMRAQHVLGYHLI